jgi:hypothetical protein
MKSGKFARISSNSLEFNSHHDFGRIYVNSDEFARFCDLVAKYILKVFKRTLSLQRLNGNTKYAELRRNFRKIREILPD